MREIILDTETTGLDAATDRIVEIGALELINRFPTGRNFHVYINPQRSMSPGAEEVHGLTDIFLADKPAFAAHVEELLAFIENATLVIHNASFDVGFLNAELARQGCEPIAAERVVDTLALARRKHPGAQNNLDALCARYGVNNANRVKHGALLDAELLADVYIELTGGRQTGLSFEPAGLTATSSARASARMAAQRPEPLPSPLTEAQFALHGLFVATLGETPVWRDYLDRP